MKTQKTEWIEEDWQNLKLSDDFLFGYVMRDAEYTVSYLVEEKPDVRYYDGRRIMIFNTAAWKKSLAQNRRDMLKYIQDGGESFESDKVSGFATKVANFKAENVFRRNYMNLGLKIMETKWEGIEQGRAEGLEQGLRQGREQGRAEAQAEAKAEIDRLKALLAEHNIPV